MIKSIVTSRNAQEIFYWMLEYKRKKKPLGESLYDKIQDLNTQINKSELKLFLKGYQQKIEVNDTNFLIYKYKDGLYAVTLTTKRKKPNKTLIEFPFFRKPSLRFQVFDGILVFEKAVGIFRPKEKTKIFKKYDLMGYIQAMKKNTPVKHLKRKYKIQEILGEGFESTVYRVQDIKTKRLFVLKVGKILLKNAFDEYQQIYENLKKSPHLKTYIRRIYSYDQNKNSLLIEYIPGNSLKHLIQKRRISRKKTLEFVREAILILANLHQDLGLYHGDPNSGNWIWERYSDKPVLIDLRYSKTISRNSKIYRQRDVFSVLYLLYEAITGKEPPHLEIVKNAIHQQKPLPKFNNIEKLFSSRDRTKFPKLISFLEKNLYSPDKITLQQILYVLMTIASEQIYIMLKRKNQLRKSDIKFITNSALSLEPPLLTKPILNLIFRFNDQGSETDSKKYLEFFTSLIEVARQHHKAKSIDKLLNEFCLFNQQCLLARARRIRKIRKFNMKRRKKIKQVFLLSRWTIGADILLNSPAIEGIKQWFPNVTIYLVGHPHLKVLFGGDARIKIVTIHYPRRGNLLKKLKSWPFILRVIERRRGNSYLVLNIASRLDQVGILPITRDEKNYIYIPDTVLPSNPNMLGLVIQRLIKTFGEPKNKKKLIPTISPLEMNINYASKISKQLNWDKKFIIAFNFGYSRPERRVGEQFEIKLIKKLVKMNAIVLFIMGLGEGELKEADKLFYKLKKQKMKLCKININVAECDVPVGKFDNAENASIIFIYTSLGFYLGLLKNVVNLNIGYATMGVHASAAIGTPTIGIYAGKEMNLNYLKKWNPQGSNPENIWIILAKNRKKDVILNEAMKYIFVVWKLWKRNII